MDLIYTWEYFSILGKKMPVKLHEHKKKLQFISKNYLILLYIMLHIINIYHIKIKYIKYSKSVS